MIVVIAIQVVSTSIVAAEIAVNCYVQYRIRHYCACAKGGDIVMTGMQTAAHKASGAFSRQILTLGARHEIARHLKATRREVFHVCERGFIDNDTSGPVSDEDMLAVLERRNIGMTDIFPIGGK